MSFKLKIFHWPTIIFLNIVYNCSSSPTDIPSLLTSAAFVTDKMLKGFQDCKLYIFFGNFKRLNIHEEFSWLNALEHITCHKNLQKYTTSVSINLQFSQNQTHDNVTVPISRPTRMLSNHCSATLLLLPTRIGYEEESKLTDILTTPLLNPPTLKNLDKFIIITNEKELITLSQSKLITSLKYKLIITVTEGNLRLHSFCPYCPEGPIITKRFDEDSTTGMNSLFPDLQTNYHGSILKLSASDKISVLMGIEKRSGKYIAKRGLYVSVLFHLIKKFNFTYEIILSSGGGSTGHQLPNKTWVGTVGDTFNGLVDFGMMADVTYDRFSVVELCATVNFAYLGFGTGPPARIYTWKTIFWPFSGAMWLAMIVTVLLSSTITSLLLKNFCFPHNNPQPLKPWGVRSIVKYFLKSLVEQGGNCPHKSGSIRVFLAYWLFFALVVTTIYKSKIVLFMMFPVVETAPESFEELADSKFEIDFHYFGNVGFNLFKTSTSPTLVTIYRRMRKEPDSLKCLYKTLSSKSACIIFGTTYERLKYSNLSDRIGNSPIRFYNHHGFMYIPGLIHQKKAAFSSNFKQVISSASEMGLLKEWKQTDFNQMLREKTALENKRKKEDMVEYDVEEFNDDVLHLPNLIGSFAVLIFGSFIASVVFIWEKVHYALFSFDKRPKQRKKKKKKLVTS